MTGVPSLPTCVKYNEDKEIVSESRIDWMIVNSRALDAIIQFKVDEESLNQIKEKDAKNQKEREETLIKIKDTLNCTHTYDILQNFPFSSETKRMGIILKERETDQIMFYVKGADAVMESKISPE